jgi:hypothetical protein
MNIDKVEQFVAAGQRAQNAADEIIKRHSRVINREYVKRWALDYARTKRSHPFSRVSEQFLNMIECDTKAAIRSRIDRHPSKGKTLM